MVQQTKIQELRNALDEKLSSNEKLNELRAKRHSLDATLQKTLDEQTSAMKTGNVREAQTQGSKLDQTISIIGDYNITVGELVGGLTNELGNYVQFMDTMKNYTFKENVAKFFLGSKKSEAMRTKRVMKQDTAKTLMDAVAYGWQLVEELKDIYGIADINHGKLTEQVNFMTEKLKAYQPKEQALKIQKDEMEKQYTALDTEFNTADATRQMELASQKDNMYKDLVKVREEHRLSLVAYNQAQQALKPNELARDSMEKMREDVASQIKLVSEKLENITTMYETAPDAIKIAMATKGMEILDKTINVITEKTADIFVKSAGAVSDATLQREEAQLIVESVMKGYLESHKKTLEDFVTRSAKVREDAMRSQQDRYK